MFKNIGKALAIMLAGAGGNRALSTKKHDHVAASPFPLLHGAGVKRVKVKYVGEHSAKRTTAAAQKRAATKRANKRKNPRGSK